MSFAPLNLSLFRVLPWRRGQYTGEQSKARICSPEGRETAPRMAILRAVSAMAAAEAVVGKGPTRDGCTAITRLQIDKGSMASVGGRGRIEDGIEKVLHPAEESAAPPWLSSAVEGLFALVVSTISVVFRRPGGLDYRGGVLTTRNTRRYNSTVYLGTGRRVYCWLGLWDDRGKYLSL